MPLKPQLKSTVAPPPAADAVDAIKTLSIPEAGYRYFGLSKNGSYDAAARGEIPFIEIGRLKRVPIAWMDKMMEQAPAAPAVRAALLTAPAPPPRTQTPVKAPKPSRYPRSAAVRRGPRAQAPVLEDTS